MKSKETLAMTFQSGDQHSTINYSTRELSMLTKPFLAEGAEFVIATGVYSNFSVANGQNTKAWVERPVADICVAVTNLLSVVERDRDLLKFNYQYSFSRDPEIRARGMRGSGGRSGFKINGLFGSVWARTPGQIYLELDKRGPEGKGDIERIDLRTLKSVETDNWGTLNIFRRSYGIHWPEKLRNAIAFLESRKDLMVKICHHYANELGT